MYVYIVIKRLGGCKQGLLCTDAEIHYAIIVIFSRTEEHFIGKIPHVRIGVPLRWGTIPQPNWLSEAGSCRRSCQ